jgi:hypothetical protein
MFITSFGGSSGAERARPGASEAEGFGAGLDGGGSGGDFDASSDEDGAAESSRGRTAAIDVLRSFFRDIAPKCVSAVDTLVMCASREGLFAMVVFPVASLMD